MKHNLRIVQIFLLIIIEIFLISEYFSIPARSQMDSGIISSSVISVILGILIVACFQKNPKELKGQIATISFVFLFSFFIVHFVNYIGWLIAPLDYDFLSQNVANRASLLSAASFNACLLGCVICTKPFKVSKQRDDEQLKGVGQVPWYIMGIFLILFIVFTDRRYFSAGGNSAVLNEIGWNPIGAASYNACVACVVANVIAVVIDKRIYSFHKITIRSYLKCFPPSFYYLTIIYLCIVLVSGDRGPMLDIMISFAFGYIVLKKYKPNILFVLLGGTIAIFALKYMSFLRGNPDSLSIDKLVAINERMASFHDNNLPIIGDMRELSDVVNAYHLVYDFAESNFIIYGVGIIIQLLAVFPGIRYLIMRVTGVPPSFYSTDQLATLLLGEEYGAGTTCVADAYYNLGFVGSVVFFILVGCLIRKLDLSLYQKGVKLFVMTMATCFFVKAIYLGRSYFFQPVTLIIYTYLILLATRFINKKKVSDEKSIIANR